MLTVLGNALLTAMRSEPPRNRSHYGDIDWSDRFVSDRQREDLDAKVRFNAMRDLW